MFASANLFALPARAFKLQNVPLFAHSGGVPIDTSSSPSPGACDSLTLSGKQMPPRFAAEPPEQKPAEEWIEKFQCAQVRRFLRKQLEESGLIGKHPQHPQFTNLICSMLENESRRHPALTRRGAEPFIDRIKTAIFEQLSKSEEGEDGNHLAELLNSIENEEARNYLTANIQKEFAKRPKVVLGVLQQKTSLNKLTVGRAHVLRQKIAKAVWGMDDMWECLVSGHKYDSEAWPTYSSSSSDSE